MEDHVELPLGLIALYWIRMFKPLIEADLPQLPGERMGFVNEAFRQLRPVAAFDLRPGGLFSGSLAAALRQAVATASRLIADMPARHLTFADDTPVFLTSYGRIPPPSNAFAIDQHFLWTFGVTRVPLPVWQALRRMAAWIEPMLIAEWIRMTQGYAERAGKCVTADQVMKALQWIEPDRDTSFVRGLALRRLQRGQPLACVWTGCRLSASSLDIDHCLPWSAWPCGDLWNLLPAAASVNRHEKRERIVSGPALANAKTQIIGWWSDGYLSSEPVLLSRFTEEARATLPVSGASAIDLEDLFQALDFRRLRLREDTRLPEWRGV
jgi:hypothetical protein